MADDDDSDGDEYDFYPCLVDDAPASIYLNLRFERRAPAAADTRYSVTIDMIDAGPHGVGSADEAAVLNAAEEALIERFTPLGLIYVGRVRNRGTWESTFYGAGDHIDALRELARERVGTRRVDAESERDPRWSYYHEFLLPDDERRQWMDDRRLVQVLQEAGDVLTVPRRVDHWACFANAPARDAFVEAIAREGFTVATATHLPDAPLPFAAQVFRTDPIVLDHIHDVAMTVMDAAEAEDGSYDGWETSIERR